MTVIINGSNVPTAGTVAVGDGTTINFTAAGSAGQVLTSNGAGVPTWTTNGAGTVTSASVVSANGFAGTVATDSTTPAITLSTSITGVLKGNGTALSAATAGTDYVAPSGALGTPSSGTLTSCTGLPISTGVSGLGTGVATALAVNVGTAGAPIVNGGDLGTPTSGTLTNATGLPISTGVSGLGTNVATWLATPSSANLISVVSDETGSGSLVFATSPTLVTPLLGTPTSGTLSNCTVDGTNAVGFRSIPPVGTKTSSYTLATGDVGKYVQVGSSGSIVVPDATFSEGDAISIFNNTSGNITITCSITTAYLAGTDADKATVTLATRGVANIFFISGTVCVITGNVS